MLNNKKRTLLAGALALYVGALAHGVYAADSLSPADFVDEASAKGLAEVEGGKIALTKATSADVKTFAQTMIDDHGKANEKLATLAKEKKLDVSDHAALMDKAKALILKLRDGESFDEAYANNQVVAHEQTIELFRKEAASSKDADLQAFAKETLPKLEHHLKMAQDLAAAHKKAD
jgi:putative membrane protein